jgi:hypothetical protein
MSTLGGVRGGNREEAPYSIGAAVDSAPMFDDGAGHSDGP